MGHLEGNFTPVLYIGRKFPKGYNKQTVNNAEAKKFCLLGTSSETQTKPAVKLQRLNS